jgi:Zn finger protein HypA/HybF involved in hydrogenase expression
MKKIVSGEKSNVKNEIVQLYCGECDTEFRSDEFRFIEGWCRDECPSCGKRISVGREWVKFVEEF